VSNKSISLLPLIKYNRMNNYQNTENLARSQSNLIYPNPQGLPLQEISKNSEGYEDDSRDDDGK
jgi:hypothetical protein